MRYLSATLSLFISLLLLTGCAHQPIGSGPVLNSMKVEKKDVLHAVGHDSTVIGTIGAGAGAVTGAIVGIGLTIVTFGLAAPLIPVTTLAGGAGGAAIGASSGAIYGYAKNHDQYLYSYLVENKSDGKKYLIHQYDKNQIAQGQLVSIYHDKGDIFYIREIKKA